MNNLVKKPHPTQGKSMDILNSFSVIILCYNSARTIGNVLKGWVNSDYPPELFEIIVAYDKSGDNSKEIIQKYPVKISESEKRSGLSGGRNRGAGVAENKYLIFTDADVIPTKDTLQQFNNALNRFPEYDVINAVYADASYESIFSQYQQSWFSYFTRLRKNYPSHILNGCCMCFEKDFFLETGGFNEEMIIPGEGEDIEFGYRLLNAGKKILICTDVEIYHDTHHTLKSFIKRNWYVHSFMLANLKHRHEDIRGKNPEYRLPVMNLFLSVLPLFFLVLLIITGYPAAFFLIVITAGYQVFLNRHFSKHIARRTGYLKLVPMYLILQLDSYVKISGLLFGLFEFYILKK